VCGELAQPFSLNRKMASSAASIHQNPLLLLSPPLGDESQATVTEPEDQGKGEKGGSGARQCTCTQ
jgi:hypothetical protein